MGAENSKSVRRDRRKRRRQQEDLDWRFERLHEELEQKRQEITELKTSAGHVMPSVSQHDRELVQDHLSTLEKKLSVAQDKASRQLSSLEGAIMGYDALTSDMEDYMEWAVEARDVLATQPRVQGFNVAHAQALLQQQADLLQQVELKQSVLDSLQRQAAPLAVGGRERDALDQRLRDLQDQHRAVRDAATDRRRQLQRAVSARQAVHGDLQRVTDWLDTRDALREDGDVRMALGVKDVARELETKKASLSEVRQFGATIERFLREGARIMEQTDDDDRVLMEEKLNDISSRYTSLKTHLETYVQRAQEALVSHKQLEADLVKVELWVKEVNSAVSRPLELDAATDLLKEQVKKYQNLANSARMQEAIVNDISDKSDDIMKNLKEEDQTKLTDRLQTVKESVNSTTAALQTSLSQLESVLSHKLVFEENLVELTRVLCVSQEELKAVSRGVGHREEDARGMLHKVQTLQAQCRDLEPSFTTLQESMSALAALGHPGRSEDLAHVTRTYSELHEALSLQQDKLSRAVTLRETFYAQRGEVETCLKACQEQMEAVDVLGVAVHTKLDRYKNVLESLKSKETDLAIIVDRSQQIGIEGSQADVDQLHQQMAKITAKAEQLQRDAQSKSDRLQTILSERQGFEDDLQKAVDLLKVKESQLRPQEHQGMDVESVSAELDRLRTIQAEVTAELRAVEVEVEEQTAKYDELDEVVPLEIQDKVAEMERLRDNIQAKLSTEEQKLVQAKASRVEFRAVWQEVSDWLKTAEECVSTDYDGVNYQTAGDELQQHQMTFASEQDIHKKMDTLLDLSETLTPTLDLNDKATLRETLKNLTAKVSDVTAAGAKRAKGLEESRASWDQYTTIHSAVDTFLDDADSEWQTTPELPLVSLEQARGQLHDTQEYISRLADQRDEVSRLSEQARQLSRGGSQASRDAADGMLRAAEEKYSKLKTQAEERQAALQETVDNWELYQEKADELKQILQSAGTVESEDIERASSTDLAQKLVDVKGLMSTVDQSQLDLSALQRAAQTVLSKLPASEAKMAIQYDLLHIQDQFEQLQWQSREQQQAIETEVVERERVTADVSVTATWLTQTEAGLRAPLTLGLEVDAVQECMDQTQELKRDINLRVAQVQHEIDQQKDKYGDDPSTMPEELRTQVIDLNQIQKKISEGLSSKEKILTNAKDARQDYHTNMGVVKSWLNDAESQLLDETDDVEDAKQRHEALVSEIALFEPKVKQLESSVERISTTASEADQNLLGSKLADLKTRWAKLLERQELKTKEFSEASELWNKLMESSGYFSDWSQQAQDTTQSFSEWSTLDQASDIIKQQRAIVSEGNELQSRFDTLDDLAEQLGKYGMNEEAKKKIEAIKEVFLSRQEESTQRLVNLEETVGEWTICQQDLESLSNWTDQTRESVHVSETGIPIQEMIEKQELVIQEIEEREEKLKDILEKQEKLRKASGSDVSPAVDQELKEELAFLKQEATKQRDDLLKLLEDQTQHEEEVVKMTAVIEEASQRTVEGSLQTVEHVDGLETHIAETNKLAEELQASEEIHITEINEQSKSLQESAQALTQNLRDVDDSMSDSTPTASDPMYTPSTDDLLAEAASLLPAGLLSDQDDVEQHLLPSTERLETLEYLGDPSTSFTLSKEQLEALYSPQPISYDYEEQSVESLLKASERRSSSLDIPDDQDASPGSHVDMKDDIKDTQTDSDRRASVSSKSRSSSTSSTKEEQEKATADEATEVLDKDQIDTLPLSDSKDKDAHEHDEKVDEVDLESSKEKEPSSPADVDKDHYQPQIETPPTSQSSSRSRSPSQLSEKEEFDDASQQPSNTIQETEMPLKEAETGEVGVVAPTESDYTTLDDQKSRDPREYSDSSADDDEDEPVTSVSSDDKLVDRSLTSSPEADDKLDEQDESAVKTDDASLTSSPDDEQSENMLEKIKPVTPDVSIPLDRSRDSMTPESSDQELGDSDKPSEQFSDVPQSTLPTDEEASPSTSICKEIRKEELEDSTSFEPKLSPSRSRSTSQSPLPLESSDADIDSAHDTATSETADKSQEEKAAPKDDDLSPDDSDAHSLELPDQLKEDISDQSITEVTDDEQALPVSTDPTESETPMVETVDIQPLTTESSDEDKKSSTVKDTVLEGESPVASGDEMGTSVDFEEHQFETEVAQPQDIAPIPEQHAGFSDASDSSDSTSPVKLKAISTEDDIVLTSPEKSQPSDESSELDSPDTETSSLDEQESPSSPMMEIPSEPESDEHKSEIEKLNEIISSSEMQVPFKDEDKPDNLTDQEKMSVSDDEDQVVPSSPVHEQDVPDESKEIHQTPEPSDIESDEGHLIEEDENVSLNLRQGSPERTSKSESSSPFESDADDLVFLHDAGEEDTENTKSVDAPVELSIAKGSIDGGQLDVGSVTMEMPEESQVKHMPSEARLDDKSHVDEMEISVETSQTTDFIDQKDSTDQSQIEYVPVVEDKLPAIDDKESRFSSIDQEDKFKQSQDIKDFDQTTPEAEPQYLGSDSSDDLDDLVDKPSSPSLPIDETATPEMEDIAGDSDNNESSTDQSSLSLQRDDVEVDAKKSSIAVSEFEAKAEAVEDDQKDTLSSPTSIEHIDISTVDTEQSDTLTTSSSTDVEVEQQSVDTKYETPQETEAQSIGYDSSVDPEKSSGKPTSTKEQLPQVAESESSDSDLSVDLEGSSGKPTSQDLDQTPQESKSESISSDASVEFEKSPDEPASPKDIEQPLKMVEPEYHSDSSVELEESKDTELPLQKKEPESDSGSSVELEVSPDKPSTPEDVEEPLQKAEPESDSDSSEELPGELASPGNVEQPLQKTEPEPEGPTLKDSTFIQTDERETTDDVLDDSDNTESPTEHKDGLASSASERAPVSDAPTELRTVVDGIDGGEVDLISTSTSIEHRDVSIVDTGKSVRSSSVDSEDDPDQQSSDTPYQTVQDQESQASDSSPELEESPGELASPEDMEQPLQTTKPESDSDSSVEVEEPTGKASPIIPTDERATTGDVLDNSDNNESSTDCKDGFASPDAEKPSVSDTPTELSTVVEGIDGGEVDILSTSTSIEHRDVSIVDSGKSGRSSSVDSEVELHQKSSDTPYQAVQDQDSLASDSSPELEESPGQLASPEDTEQPLQQAKAKPDSDSSVEDEESLGKASPIIPTDERATTETDDVIEDSDNTESSTERKDGLASSDAEKPPVSDAPSELSTVVEGIDGGEVDLLSTSTSIEHRDVPTVDTGKSGRSSSVDSEEEFHQKSPDTPYKTVQDQESLASDSSPELEETPGKLASHEDTEQQIQKAKAEYDSGSSVEDEESLGKASPIIPTDERATTETNDVLDDSDITESSTEHKDGLASSVAEKPSVSDAPTELSTVVEGIDSGEVVLLSTSTSIEQREVSIVDTGKSVRSSSVDSEEDLHQQSPDTPYQTVQDQESLASDSSPELEESPGELASQDSPIIPTDERATTETDDVVDDTDNTESATKRKDDLASSDSERSPIADAPTELSTVVEGFDGGEVDILSTSTTTAEHRDIPIVDTGKSVRSSVDSEEDLHQQSSDTPYQTVQDEESLAPDSSPELEESPGELASPEDMEQPLQKAIAESDSDSSVEVEGPSKSSTEHKDGLASSDSERPPISDAPTELSTVVEGIDVGEILSTSTTTAEHRDGPIVDTDKSDRSSVESEEPAQQYPDTRYQTVQDAEQESLATDSSPELEESPSEPASPEDMALQKSKSESDSSSSSPIVPINERARTETDDVPVESVATESPSSPSLSDVEEADSKKPSVVAIASDLVSTDESIDDGQQVDTSLSIIEHEDSVSHSVDSEKLTSSDAPTDSSTTVQVIHGGEIDTSSSTITEHGEGLTVESNEKAAVSDAPILLSTTIEDSEYGQFEVPSSPALAESKESPSLKLEGDSSSLEDSETDDEKPPVSAEKILTSQISDVPEEVKTEKSSSDECDEKLPSLEEPHSIVDDDDDSSNVNEQQDSDRSGVDVAHPRKSSSPPTSSSDSSLKDETEKQQPEIPETSSDDDQVHSEEEMDNVVQLHSDSPERSSDEDIDVTRKYPSRSQEIDSRSQSDSTSEPDTSKRNIENPSINIQDDINTQKQDTPSEEPALADSSALDPTETKDDPEGELQSDIADDSTDLEITRPLSDSPETIQFNLPKDEEYQIDVAQDGRLDSGFDSTLMSMKGSEITPSETVQEVDTTPESEQTIHEAERDTEHTPCTEDTKVIQPSEAETESVQKSPVDETSDDPAEFSEETPESTSLPDSQTPQSSPKQSLVETQTEPPKEQISSDAAELDQVVPEDQMDGSPEHSDSGSEAQDQFPDSWSESWEIISTESSSSYYSIPSIDFAPLTSTPIVPVESQRQTSRAPPRPPVLSPQEAYQTTLQDVTRRLEAAQLRVRPTDTASVTSKDIHQQMDDNKDLALELELLDADIRSLRDQGEQLARDGTDPEGHRAIMATLKMLEDRYDGLKGQAADREEQLQETAARRAAHDAALQRYTARVREHEDWLTDAKITHAGDPMMGYDVTYLRNQIRANQTLQSDLSARIQRLSDLRVECDQLAEFEPAERHTALGLQLTQLQDNTGRFRLETAQKLDQLKDALKESEKKKRELAEYRESVEHLSKWIGDSKTLPQSSPEAIEASNRISEQQRLNQQKLSAELTQHQDLVLSVSKAAERVIRSRPPGDGASIGSEDEAPDLTPEAVQAKWQLLSRQLSEKKQQLQDTISHSQPEDFQGQPLHLFRPLHRSTPSDPSSSTRLLDTRRSLAELNACWEKLQGQVEDKQARLEVTLQYQTLYQEALLNISSWLDDIENRLLNPAPGRDKSTEELLAENELLQRELESLQGELSEMARASQQLMVTASTESRALISQTLDDVRGRVVALEEHAGEREERLRRDRDTRARQQSEASDLQTSLTTARQRYADLATSNLPLDQRLAAQHRLREEIAGYEARVRDMQAEGNKMAASDPRYVMPLELVALQNSLKDVQDVVADQTSDLEQAQTLYNQYVRLLAEYESYLDTAQNKVRDDRLTARDLPQLQQQLSAHKDFFADLESHRTLLDSLAQGLDPATRAQYQPQHTRLTNHTHVIQDRAAIYGQRLERLIQDWVGFQEQFDDLRGWMAHLERRLPEQVDQGDAVTSVEELRQKIWDYHTLQKDLDDEKALMYEVVDCGRQLVQGVSCPALEAELADFAEQWVKISNEVNTQLKRLQTLTDQWEQFERDASTLEDWLDSAQNRAGILSELKNVDTQNIVVLRNKMEHFLSFRKEVENQQPLKTKVSTLGNQLHRVRPLDQSLQSRVQRLEDQWLSLVSDLPNNEEHLHQAQMELLPSRQALNELMLWLDGIETTLREDHGRVLLNLVDTQVMLQKYRCLKVDINNRQLTVDFVNQSSLQTSTMDLDSSTSSMPRTASQLHEKTEFDERLGQMNKRHQAATSDVLDRVKNLEMLEIRWTDFEKKYNNIVSWTADQEDKVEKYGKIGHEASIQQAVRECQVLKEKLTAKSADIESVRQLGLSLVETHHGRTTVDGEDVIDTMVNELLHKVASIDDQVSSTAGRLQDALRHWALYTSAQQSCTTLLTETEYAFHRFNVASGEIDVFSTLINKLKTLQSDFEARSGRLQQLTDTASNLLRVCEQPAAQSVQKSVDDIQTRWQKMTSSLNSRITAFEDLYEKWGGYEGEFERVHAWVTDKEASVDNLLQSSKDDDDFDKATSTATELLQEVEAFRQNLKNLAELSNRLTQHMDNPTVIHLKTRETSISQRLHSLHQALSRFINSLQTESTNKSHFRHTYDTVDAFLSAADSILRSDDPNKSAEEDHLRGRIDQLKELTSKFSHAQPDLDSLNLIGYRLPLSENNSSRLKSLNQRWYNLHSDTAERFKAMQGHLLLQQDFSEKCQEWMTFLARVEKDLAAPIATSYDELLRQQKSHDVFQNEMYSRQQILHSIVAEGRQMIREGDVEDRFDFEQKLNLLEDQWQSVLRRGHQRKQIIDNHLRQWAIFRDSLERLQAKLRSISAGLSEVTIQGATMQKIRNMYNNIKQCTSQALGYNIDNSLHEFERLLKGKSLWLESKQHESGSVDPLYHRTVDNGKVLMQNGDVETRQQVQNELDEVHEDWKDVIGQLDKKQSQLEGTISQWEETEEGMEDLLDWLKGIRKSLLTDIPENFDDLQRELHQCSEYQTSFNASEDRLDQLSESHAALSSTVHPQDSGILQQRLLLLRKQWAELQHQVALRQTRLNERLARWTTFSDKYRDIMDWMVRMEDKISAGKEYHIEDFLAKLENEYKDELRNIDQDREHLSHDGQRLMAASGEIRANDISYKLSKVHDRWGRLRDKAAARQKKLKETLTVVQQLETSMRQLRQWLASIEHQLGSPLVYSTPDFREIQGKLKNQQECQRDIQKHSTGVASVVNLCEVLLHDTDACPTATEQTAIQQAIDSLDRRWKNICDLSMGHRQRIDETWKYWQRFHDDHQRMCDWLRDAERQVENPRTENATFVVFKEELHKFENFQRTLHEKLQPLEQLNKQYRRMAREGRTDTDGQLKHQIKEVNRRWDELSKVSQTILKRLRHLINVRDDFGATREALMVWLREINSRITNLEHFSESGSEKKLNEIQTIQAEIEENSQRLEYIDQASGYLLQRCDPRDTLAIQKDVDDFRNLVEKVVSRINRFKAKLEAKVTSGEESEDTDDDLEFKEIPNLAQIERLVEDMEDYPLSGDVLSDSDSDYEEVASGPPMASTPRETHALRTSSPRPPTLRQPARGVRGEEPASLDWAEMSDGEEEEMQGTPRRSRRDDADGSPSLSAAVRARVSAPDKLARVEGYLRELEAGLEGVNTQLRAAEGRLRAATPTGGDSETATGCYSALTSSCQNSVDALNALGQRLKQETGLPSLYGADAQIKGAVSRWHSIQRAALDKDRRLEASRHQWAQYRADLTATLGWLEQAQATQATQTHPPSEIGALEAAVRRHREFLSEVDARRPVILSINLVSKDLITPSSPREATRRLAAVNQRWDRVCACAAVWQKELQIALLQCDDFHRTLGDLESWLHGVQADVRRLEPVDLGADRDRLLAKHRSFRDLRFELQKGRDKVQSLQVTTSSLLADTSPRDAASRDTEARLASVSSQCDALLAVCGEYMARLEGVAGVDRSMALGQGTISPVSASLQGRDLSRPPPYHPASITGQRSPRSYFSRRDFHQSWPCEICNQIDSTDAASAAPVTSQRPSSFLSRVCRTALPIQGLMLLLLGAASLVPMSQEDFSCTLANNFRQSLEPMLQYTEGPPPF